MPRYTTRHNPSYVKGKIHKYLVDAEVDHSEQLERMLNYHSLARYIDDLRRNPALDESAIKTQVLGRLKQGPKGDRGKRIKIYNAGAVRRGKRWFQQAFRYSLPTDYDITEKRSALSRISSDASLPRDLRDAAGDAYKLEGYRTAIRTLREADLIDNRYAARLEGKIGKENKRRIHEITDIISSEVTAILLLAVGSFLLGASLKNPSVLGMVILENKEVLTGSSIIAPIIFLVGLLMFIYHRSRRQ